MDANVRASCEASGLKYARHPERVPNTRLALELGEQARDEGLHEAFHQRAMEAMWAEQQDLGDEAVLRALAAGCGVSAEGIELALVGRVQRDRVEASTAQAHSLGITAIPAFVLHRSVLVSGAQPHDAFEQAWRQGPYVPPAARPA